MSTLRHAQQARVRGRVRVKVGVRVKVRVTLRVRSCRTLTLTLTPSPTPQQELLAPGGVIVPHRARVYAELVSIDRAAEPGLRMLTAAAEFVGRAAC